MSRDDRLSFLGEWPSLVSDRDKLRARAYERSDGMRYLYFAPVFDTVTPPRAFSQLTRVAYRSKDSQALFLGMFIRAEDRGRRLGERLIAHFMANVEPAGDRFIGTGVIHKPVIALSLGRVGLEPVSTDFVAEILPKAASDKTDVPKIEILKNNLSADSIVDRSGSNQFYEVVPAAEAARYPINGPDMTVALHTPYVPVLTV